MYHVEVGARRLLLCGGHVRFDHEKTVKYVLRVCFFSQTAIFVAIVGITEVAAADLTGLFNLNKEDEWFAHVGPAMLRESV